jgi:hypothetical protein
VTDYFVRKTGSNAAAGTSPATAWATIDKALDTIVSGDTVYIGAGTYREMVSSAASGGTTETRIVGDVDGAMTGDVGEVILTAFLTNDTTAPSASNLIQMNGRDFLTFEKLTLIGGGGNSGSVFNGSAGGVSTNITFRDCTINAGPGSAGGAYAFYGSFTQAIPLNWLFERCRFLQPFAGGAFQIFALTSASADYDLNVGFRNCVFLGGGRTIYILSTGSDSFKAGGVRVENCTFLGTGECFFASGPNLSTAIPCRVTNSILNTNSTALRATTTGQLVEDGNWLLSSGPRLNVTAGATSFAGYTYAPLFHAGQELAIGQQPRPFMTPMMGSPALGFGNVGQVALLTDLVGHWKMDEASGNALDAHGSRTFTDTNTVTSAAGKLGTSRQFTAANNEYFARSGTDADLDPGAQPAYWACWAWFDSLATQRTLFARRGGTNEYIMEVQPSGALRFFSWHGGVAKTASLAGVVTGSWHFLEAYWDPATNLIGVAMNGSAFATAATGGAAQDTGATSSEIGGSNVGGPVMDGRIDSLSYWKGRILSSVERAVLYNAGAGLEYPFSYTPTYPAPTTDLLNRPRPAGAASIQNAVGAYERHDTATRETSVTDDGGVGIRLVGPSDQEVHIPVEASATTITVRARYDTLHGATNKPRAVLLDNGEIGVATQTATMTVAVDTWETLTLGPFTPTAKGWVTVRLESRAANGGGIAYFDTVGVS